jgi:hypothetical protein
MEDQKWREKKKEDDGKRRERGYRSMNSSEN